MAWKNPNDLNWKCVSNSPFWIFFFSILILIIIMNVNSRMYNLLRWLSMQISSIKIVLILPVILRRWHIFTHHIRSILWIESKNNICIRRRMTSSTLLSAHLWVVMAPFWYSTLSNYVVIYLFRHKSFGLAYVWPNFTYFCLGVRP